MSGLGKGSQSNLALSTDNVPYEISAKRDFLVPSYLKRPPIHLLAVFLKLVGLRILEFEKTDHLIELLLMCVISINIYRIKLKNF